VLGDFRLVALNLGDALRLEMEHEGIGGGLARSGFLRRQFLPPTSRPQVIFDLLFGAVAPILCFVFDPIAFKSWEVGDALFPKYQAFVYLVSGIEILLLILQISFGKQLQSTSRIVGGMLMSGAIFAGLIGLVLLPFSFLGLFLGIGVFGFTPFLTALVYLRNARSAFRLARALDAKGTSWERNYTHVSVYGGWLSATIIGCVLALGPPAALSYAASMFVTQAMNAVLGADQRQADLAIDELKYLKFFARPELDSLVVAYEQTNEQARREELKRRFLRLTGDDIEKRRRILND
jgi:hypothetical protein